jgi:beta-lactamase class A
MTLRERSSIERSGVGDKDRPAFGTCGRRAFLVSGAAAILEGSIARSARAANVAQTLSRIEARSGGRLGVFARDLSTGRTIAHRADERFPMCSTFKMLAVGTVLHRVDRGLERLDRRIVYGAADLLEYAPVTRANLRAGSMSVDALCAAAIVWSDNTAANLLLHAVGGPPGVTAFVRSDLGDPITRLDRFEPDLNSAIPGDPRDTTTPRLMASAVTKLLTTFQPLSIRSSFLLLDWMRDCKTGTTALRAGVPVLWGVADKTGSGDRGTRNDIALFEAPGGKHIAIATYLTGATAIDGDARNGLLARVAALVANTLGAGAFELISHSQQR